jgi:hypothetical protein
LVFEFGFQKGSLRPSVSKARTNKFYIFRQCTYISLYSNLTANIGELVPYGNLHLMIITDFEHLFVCTQLCFHRRLPFCLLYLVQKQPTINRRMIYSIIDCLYGTFAIFAQGYVPYSVLLKLNIKHAMHLDFSLQ